MVFLKVRNWFFRLVFLVFCHHAWGQSFDLEPIRAMLDTSQALAQSFSGFVLHDLDTDREIFARYPEKYMTPASNIKLYTFYAALQLLDSRMAGLKYSIQGDSLLFWGNGSPTFLNPDFGDTLAFVFLRDFPGKLYYLEAPFEDDGLGPGWSWSEYNAYYSTEKSVFPIYANNAIFQLGTPKSGPVPSAVFFSKLLERRSGKGNGYPIEREAHSNHFVYYPEVDAVDEEAFVPFKYATDFFLRLLQDTLKRPVSWLPHKQSFPPGQLLYTLPIDTVYRRMLQESDNFLAEQLLLMCSAALSDTLASSRAIDYVLTNYLRDLPDEPVWVDGSGLSRYNMVTPRTTVALLIRLYQQLERERLFGLLAAGGVSGTIKSWYAAPEGMPPYIFAKTGTLSNNHCLSGYLQAKSGKVLAFSFMHNHYTGASGKIKTVMENILAYIRDNY